MSALIRRVVILGHSGFIGGQLFRVFAEQFPSIELIGKSFPEIDLTNPESIPALADLFAPETAVILCSGIKKQMGDNLDIFTQNIQMVVNVCRLLQSHPVRRLVYMSSGDVYGEDVQNPAITEQTPVNPVSYYGIAKYASEGLLRKTIRAQLGSSLLILRPPLIYGTGDTSKGYGPAGFAWAAANNQEITLWGDGSERREFIFVEDIARIICRLTFQDYDGVLNVASGKNYTFRDILEILARLIPHEFRISSRPRTKSKVDQGYCNDLLTQLLPDVIFTPLEEGVRQTFAAVQKQIVT